MPPKAPVKKGGVKGKGSKPDGGSGSGLIQDCPFPIWTDEEVDHESWGDMSAESITLFEDGPVPDINTFGAFLKEWKRPHALFSPFKPVVVRPNLNANPYEIVQDEQGNSTDDQLEEAYAKLEAYRLVKPFKPSEPVRMNITGVEVQVESAQGSSNFEQTGTTTQSQSHKKKSRKGGKTPTPNFMLAFNSALMCVAEKHKYVGRGKYLWECVYPQQSTSGYKYPLYNPCGKYCVRLWWCGAFRKVIVDDRLPTDIYGNSMLTVTHNKELWPALLAKAMLKVLLPFNESQLFSNPAWCLTTLLGGWIPQHLSPTTATTLILKYTRQEQMLISTNQDEDPDMFQNAEQVPSQKGKRQTAVTPTKAKRDDKKSVEDEELNEIDKETERVLITTVCTNQSEKQTDLINLGLVPENIYLLVAAKPHQHTTLLRLQSPHVDWKGEYSYENDCWTSGELEAQLGFSRMENELLESENGWKDFWITWEQFCTLFSTVQVFRNINARKYQNYHHLVQQDILTMNAEREKEKAASAFSWMKNEAKASASNLGPPQSPAGLEDQLPFVRYLYVKNSVPTQVMFAFTGLIHPNSEESAHPSTTEDDPKHRKSKGVSPTSKTRPAVNEDGGHTNSLTTMLSEITQVETEYGESPTIHITNEAKGSPSLAAAAAAQQQQADLGRPVDTPGSVGQHVEPAMTLTISAYNWTSSCPTQFMSSVTCKRFSTDSFILQVPKGEHTYKLELSFLYPESLFAILSSRELVLADLQEVQSQYLGVSMWVDVGEYSDHLPNEWNIWFKRHFSIKQDTSLSMELSLLPHGTDLSTIPTNATLDMKKDKGSRLKQADKKSTPAKDSKDRKRKGSTVYVEDTAALLAQRQELARSFAQEGVEPTLDITAFINLEVINCDNGQTLEGVVTRIPYTTLEANKNGYIIMGHGTTPTWYPSGNYKLQIMSAQPLQGVEQRAFDALNTRDGKYRHNPNCMLFKYNVTATELTYGSLFLRVLDDGQLGTTYTFSITRNNNEVLYERKDTKDSTIIIPNIWFHPSDKVTANKYNIEASINETMAKVLQQRQHEAAVEAFQQEQKQQYDNVKANLAELAEKAAEQKAQAEEIRSSQEELLETPRSEKGEKPSKSKVKKGQENEQSGKGAAKKDKKKEGEGHRSSTSDTTAAPPPTFQWEPTPAPNEVVFCLRLYTNSQKLVVEEDTTLSDEIANTKMKWGKPDMEVALPTNTGKGKEKATAAQELMQQRQQKSKEIRQKYQQNMTGLFVPQILSNEEIMKGKLPLVTEDDDENYRCVNAMDPEIVQTTTEENLIILTEELRQVQQRAHEQTVQTSQQALQGFTKRREIESKHLLEMVQSDEQQIQQLRLQRQKQQDEEKARREKYWQSKRAEESLIRQINAENEAAAEEASTSKKPPPKGKKGRK